MRLWYLSHRRPEKAQASLRIRAVSPEPSLFAYIQYGSRRRVRPKIKHLALLDGCACARLKDEFTRDEKCHNLMSWLEHYFPVLWELGCFEYTVLLKDVLQSVCSVALYEPRQDKTNKMSLRPAKTQISLGIRPV